MISALQGYLARHPEATLITVCGSREPLYDAMQEQYGRHPQMELLRRTDRMAEYMRASDAVISKPGGLSSTEAAAIGVPLLHISPIPGCESKNAAYFSGLGMSVCVGQQLERLGPVLEQLSGQDAAQRMVAAQRREVSGRAAETICAFAEGLN